MSFLKNIFGSSEKQIIENAKQGQRSSAIIIFDLAEKFADSLIDIDGRSSEYRKFAKLEAILFLSYYGRTNVPHGYRNYVDSNYLDLLVKYMHLSNIDKKINGRIDIFLFNRINFYTQEMAKFIEYMNINEIVLPVKAINFLYDNPLSTIEKATGSPQYMMMFQIKINSIMKAMKSLPLEEMIKDIVLKEANFYNVPKQNR